MKNRSETCGFFVKLDKTRNKKRMAPICLDCLKNFDGQVMMWDGGFGHDKDVVCDKCGYVIRKYEGKYESKKETTPTDKDTRR